MAGIIDTNILLYAVNDDSPFHRKAVDFLSGHLEDGNRWYLTDGILYEFLRVSTHARVFECPLTWQQSVAFLDALVTREDVRILSAGIDHWSLLKDRLPGVHHPAGNLFFDIRTYTLMVEHSIRRIYTADSDFLQFKDIKAINPLA